MFFNENLYHIALTVHEIMNLAPNLNLLFCYFTCPSIFHILFISADAESSLDRNFTSRLRCLLDESSGFLVNIFTANWPLLGHP